MRAVREGERMEEKCWRQNGGRRRRGEKNSVPFFEEEGAGARRRLEMPNVLMPQALTYSSKKAINSVSKNNLQLQDSFGNCEIKGWGL